MTSPNRSPPQAHSTGGMIRSDVRSLLTSSRSVVADRSTTGVRVDGSQFDRLARDLAQGQSRRHLLTRLVGGAALALGLPGARVLRSPSSAAAATCRVPDEICRK